MNFVSKQPKFPVVCQVCVTGSQCVYWFIPGVCCCNPICTFPTPDCQRKSVTSRIQVVLLSLVLGLELCRPPRRIGEETTYDSELIRDYKQVISSLQ